ncbi:YdcF family protein [Kamptonema sp. UHCC 0994]|uniref:YdcF family protein n=1 Tax=Kamptonema sp. UHCC 0994 TaxID=3031329 RepID=UPI0023B8CA0D|nr:YdcF family protein [Kamptonema sp. UHCC 0994]MDF0555570.1 YdcF family protein [Kamptonema sp. UHCC 0994]
MTNYQLPITNYQLPITNYQLPITKDNMIRAILILLVFIYIIYSNILAPILPDEKDKNKYESLVVLLMVSLIVTLAIIGIFTPNSQLATVVRSALIVLLTTPLGLAVLLLIFATTGIVSGGIRNPTPKRIISALVLLIIASNPLVALSIAEQAEREILQLIQVETCCQNKVGAIVLIGQGTTEPKLPYRVQIQLTDAGDRISYAAKLYRHGLAPYLIVSAGSRPDIEGHFIEASDIKRLLLKMGVLAEDIILETKSKNLHESAIQIKKILESKGLLDRIILVTSAIQMHRATQTFIKERMKVSPAPTDFYTFELNPKLRRRLMVSDFFPSAQALSITTRIIEEDFAYLYYFVRGWLG